MKTVSKTFSVILRVFSCGFVDRSCSLEN